MPNRILDFINELQQLYSWASPKEISEIFVQEIQNALPEIALEVRPSDVSPVQKALERLKQQRVPRKLRTQIGERDSFWSDIMEFQKISGEAYDTSDAFNYSIFKMFDGHDSRFTGIVQPAYSHPPQMLKPATLSSRLLQPRVLAGTTLHVKFELYEATYPIVTLVSTLEDMVSKDKIFELLMRTVEVSLRDCPESKMYKFEISCTLEPDVELPSWKPLSVRIKSKAIEFEDKMNLWDKIDDAVRKSILELASRLSTEEALRIKELNNNLFIQMDISE